jgi:flavin reductase (DIM6/NTAB) family NADH-FMN oxidoreductase RutF
MFKNVPLEKSYRLIGSGPCVLITSGKGGKINVAPVAWTTPINDEPALVGISVAEGHYTTELILETGEFAINVPSEKLLPKLMAAGKVSGRNADKFAKTGLTPSACEKISAPYIKECAGYLECRVKESHRYEGVVFFVAEVLAAKAEDELFSDRWISAKARTLHHLSGGEFILGEKSVFYK